MAAEAVGTIYIDFIADIAKFVSPVKEASNELTRFAAQAVKSVDQVEKNLQKLGTSLSLKLTAPLAGLAIAAVKAADTNGDFADSLERLRRQAQAALIPLGEGLVEVFNRDLRPAIEDGVKFVNGLSQAFKELDPEVRRNIILATAGAAAIGPVLLGMSALLGITKAVLVTFSTLAGIVAGTVTPFGKLTIAVRSFLSLNLAYSLGQYFSQFKLVSQAVYLVSEGVEAVWKGIINGGRLAGVAIGNLFRTVAGVAYLAISGISTKIAVLIETISSIAPDLDSILINLTGIDPGIASITAPAASFFRDIATETQNEAKTLRETNGRTYQEALDALNRDQVKFAEDYAALYEDLDSEFDVINKGRRSFFGILLGDIGSEFQYVGEKLVDSGVLGIASEFGDLLARASELASKVQIPEVVTQRDLSRMKELNKEAADFAKLGLDAKEALSRAFPQRKDPFIRQLQEFRQANLTRPDIFSDEALLASAARLSAELKKVEDEANGVAVSIGKALRDAFDGASRAAADSFADMVVDGKFAVQELLKSFLKLAIATSTQNLFFGPIFSAIGKSFNGLPNVADASSNTSFDPAANPVGARHGAAFAYGSPIPFARGGVVTREALFGMKGGRLGKAGEAGPEAILPLTRIGQDLGVKAQMSGVEVNIIDQRSGGERPQVSERRGPNGQKVIDVTIRDTVKGMFSDGTFDRSMSDNFGIRRRASPR